MCSLDLVTFLYCCLFPSVCISIFIMYFSSPLVTVLSLCSRSSAASNIQRRDLDSFVGTERAIALQGVLNNIGPHGSQVPGTAAGIIIASPSKSDPDCKYLQYLVDTALILPRLLHLDPRFCFDHKDDRRRIHLGQCYSGADNQRLYKGTSYPSNSFQPFWDAFSFRAWSRRTQIYGRR